jgi:hypothetical protein
MLSNEINQLINQSYLMVPGGWQYSHVPALRILVDLYCGAWGGYGDLLPHKDLILLTDICHQQKYDTTHSGSGTECPVA